jgi:hypothetical protein
MKFIRIKYKNHTNIFIINLPSVNLVSFYWWDEEIGLSYGEILNDKMTICESISAKKDDFFAFQKFISSNEGLLVLRGVDLDD